MSPSSNFRCGTCLSIFNGKIWEEQYKCVLSVKSWSLVLNENNELCIEGICDNDLDLAVCIPITDRLNNYWVSNDQTLVKLRGIFNKKEVPEYVAGRFAQGIPSNWKEIVNKWIEFVQRGEQSSFCWDDEVSFDSSDTSFLLQRSRRVISGRKADGKLKGKSIQRPQGATARDVEDERDSAVPTTKSSDSSTAKAHQLDSPPMWHPVSPQLPAHKVKEIFQWMSISHQSGEPLDEVEEDKRDTSAKFIAPSAPVLKSKSRLPNSETGQRKTYVPQRTSTPQVPTSAEDAENVIRLHSSLSSINNSHSLNSDIAVFGKSHPQNQSSPKSCLESIPVIPPSYLDSTQETTSVPGTNTSSDEPLINLVSKSVFRKLTQGQPSKSASKTVSRKLPPNSSNAEVPGNRMGRMLSSSLRPRRRQTLQKIERWRPILGVDGCLKVQGYLLLQCDMTAGQILTTNTVVEWGARRVVTCDGREYELVGDPSGKIPEDLKTKLLKPMECADITSRLQEFQGLKEDVMSCPYLAPPPTPMMMSMTRSGRLSRPRAPYWLNRSDWGPEYEVFYENDGCDMTINKSSRTTSNVRNNSRTTARHTPAGRQKLKSSTLIMNNQEASTRVMDETTNQNQMMLPRPRLCADASNVDYSSSRIKVSYPTKSTPENIQNFSELHPRSPVIDESYSSNECTPKSRPSLSTMKRVCLPRLQDSKPHMASHSPHSPLTRRQIVPEKTTTRAMSPPPVRKPTKTCPPVFQSCLSNRKTPVQVKKTPRDKQATSKSLNTRLSGTSDTNSSRRKTPERPKTPPSPKYLRGTSRTLTRQLRVLVHRLDPKKNLQNGAKQSPLRRSFSLRSRRKKVSTETKLTPPASNRNEKKGKVSAAKKTSNEKPVEVTKKINKRGGEKINRKRMEKSIKKDDGKKTKNVGKNKSEKTPATKRTPAGPIQISDDNDTASECSSDSSVGPSASIVFQLSDPPVTRGKPRTLKERRERDAKLTEMGKKLAAKESLGLDADDDPMADLIASHKFSPLPQEWCRHENFLGKSRKRRRPSSSDGTVSPSRSGLDDGFGNEDATSSVATPQLLMRPPDPKQVQSYLQRQRAWNAKPQRVTHQAKGGNDKLLLPHIDYASVFRPEISDSEDGASAVSAANSDWEA